MIVNLIPALHGGSIPLVTHNNLNYWYPLVCFKADNELISELSFMGAKLQKKNVNSET